MINIVVEALASFIDSVVCILFITFFLGKKIKDHPKLIALFIALIFGLTLIHDYALPMFDYLSTFVLMGVSIVYAVMICEKHYIKALISACIYKAVIILCSSFLFTFFSNYIIDFAVLLQGTHSFQRYLLLLIHKVLLITILSVISKVFKANDLKSVAAGLITFAISLMTVVGMGVTMFLVSAPEFKDYSAYCILLVLCFFVINFGVYFLIRQIQRLEKEKYELKLIEDRMSFQEQKYNEVMSVWDSIRKIQHDMKHHLAVINGQLDDAQYDECQKYVKTLLPNVERMGSLVRSDNAVIDYLINSKLAPLKDKNTEVIVSGIVSDFSDIQDTDLVCIVGNILDNAIEAVDKLPERRIELHFMKQNASRMIICRNTIAESVLEKNSDLKSTKKDSADHGLGHKIVERTAKQYGGIVDYSESNGMFCVQIMFVGME